MGSDQTSCHNVFNGGYYPVGLSFDEANKLMTSDKPAFEKLVQKRWEVKFDQMNVKSHFSLIRQINAIERLAKKGMRFWEYVYIFNYILSFDFSYGNAFLYECHRAGADILLPDAKDDKSFIYPSYFHDIMGDIFSMGFG